jgi:protein-L-isoaspartate(D-aspartate) O-methyltransferase
MDIERARFNMVEQQIRTWEVLDPEVLELLFTVKREDFVPPQYRALAFADLELPLGAGQAMWAPKMEARVLQELAIKPGERVLEIGTGSGYFTALLAARGALVTSVEIDAKRAAEARAKLARNGVTGSTPVLADAFAAQLAPGGRLFAVVGEAPVMKARLVRWTAPGTPVSTDLFETVIPPLINAPQPARFTF